MTLSTLLIFDIDGTLIRENRASKTAYLQTLRSCYGIRARHRDLLLSSGKTDLIIIGEILGRFGINIDQVDTTRLIAEYARHLERAASRDPGVVLPGVRPLLDTLQADDSVRLALATGNVEIGARIKLAVHGLTSYFPVGAFGTDAALRPDIISATIAKARKEYSLQFGRIVVIGDTPHDIEAANQNRVYSIAVATGPFSLEQLQSRKPTAALWDLSRTELFLSTVDSFPPLGAPGRQ